MYGNIYAAGTLIDSSKYSVVKWDGISWSKLGIASAIPMTGPIWKIAADRIGNVYAAGFSENSSGSYYVAKWDGTSWSELGSDTNALNANGPIFSVVTDSNMNVYAAGAFSNSVGKSYVAKWNGSKWVELGTGSNGLNGNGEIYSVAISSAHVVFTGGNFTDSATQDEGTSYVAYYQMDKEDLPKIYDECLFEIFPNPCNNILNIQSDKSVWHMPYYITDLSGKIVNFGYIYDRHTVVNIASAPRGSYLFVIPEKKYCLKFEKR